MIEGLNTILENSDQPGLSELRTMVAGLLDGQGVEGRLVGVHMLHSHAHLSRVFRLRFLINGQLRSIIVKRLRPENTRRSELAAKRWLPAVGLGHHGPPLLASVTELSGLHIWHAYDELGENELDSRWPIRERVRAAIELIVQVHTRFAGHPMLGEIRMHGRELGVHFYESTTSDAILALEAVHPPEEHRRLHGHLLQRLYKLREELPARRQAFKEWGGPETLLHGDLWPTNVFVIPTPKGLHARMIDWDLSGIGPISYDLSTFLLRFEPSYRNWILETYTEEMARAGWRMPPEQELNYLFETQEYARFANRVIWPSIALMNDPAPWAWIELAMVDEWFEGLKPVLELEPRKPANSFA